MEEARHAEERGAILLALKQGYDQEMVSVGSLSKALNMVGSPMTVEGLQFSLSLLADSEYIKIWRAKAMGKWRADRVNEMRPDTIMFARLAPKGLLLIDGQIEADPLVTF
jgi:hypothetical protein